MYRNNATQILTKRAGLRRFLFPLAILVMSLSVTLTLWKHLDAMAAREAAKLTSDDYEVEISQKSQQIEVAFDQVYDSLRMTSILAAAVQPAQASRSFNI